MRPKDLKFPFSWNERRPAFYEGVFIVPQYYDQHHLWNDGENLFYSKQPFCIEYCSGNGDWVLEKAKQHPHQRWIAVEKKFERVRKIWSKMRNQAVENLLIVCGEGLAFTRHYLPENSLQEAYVNFPDPWPKDRQAKHRIIQAPFIEELSKAMIEKGTATYVTDHPDYRSQMIAEMGLFSEWESTIPHPFYSEDWQDYGYSWFESLWKEEGRNIYYMQFEKK